MPLHGQEILRERVGGEEWIVKFGSLAVVDRVCAFVVHKVNEAHPQEENLFWLLQQRHFDSASRSDIPEPLLEFIKAWLTGLVSSVNPERSALSEHTTD